MSRYDHIDVTGIVEEGVHAKVDAAATFVVTPLGLTIKKIAPAVVLETEKKKYGEKLGQSLSTNELQSLLGEDLVYLPDGVDRYIKSDSVQFEKYDDGWKLPTKN